MGDFVSSFCVPSLILFLVILETLHQLEALRDRYKGEKRTLQGKDTFSKLTIFFPEMMFILKIPWPSYPMSLFKRLIFKLLFLSSLQTQNWKGG